MADADLGDRRQGKHNACAVFAFTAQDTIHTGSPHRCDAFFAK
ncbi:MAG: hypothetical protein SCM11_15425 [Bacillota bacterium]|nr:hypothetical protein [Bacillota bacterium]